MVWSGRKVCAHEAHGADTSGRIGSPGKETGIELGLSGWVLRFECRGIVTRKKETSYSSGESGP